MKFYLRILVLALVIPAMIGQAAVWAEVKIKKPASLFLKPSNKKVFPFNRSDQKPIPLYPGASQERIGLSVGIKAGASAGLTGAMGDVTYSLSNLVPGAAVRGSIGYLTGTNIASIDKLKMATVNLDGILDILKQDNTPLNVYVGGGLIYPWKVSQTNSAGAWGAHAYLGGKYALQRDVSVYGEIAYSGIKYDANQSALKGVEAMVGYGYSF
ncbi:MAG: hypothetical protein AABZ57_08165 [Candidatus Margulisiibacteriota bacterium]